MALYKYETLKSEYNQFRGPLSVIKVSGKRIADNKSGFIIGDVSVDLTSGYEASIASFCIYNCFDEQSKTFNTQDLKKYICLGQEVTILLGYSTLVKSVFTGFISKVNYNYNKNDMPHIMVTCMDAKGIMMANMNNRQLAAQCYSDAVSEILQKAAYVRLQSMEVLKDLKISNTPDRLDGAGQTQHRGTIEMVAESDYEFIVRAAKRFNYEFFIDCGDLIFRKAKSSKQTIFELTPETDIYTMDVQYDCTGVAGTVVVRGTDIDQGKVIEKKLKNNNKFSLGSSAKQLVKNNQKTYTDAGIVSSADADNKAEYLMDEISYRFGLLECECIGIPEIKPGYFIEVSSFGEGISNQFYVVNVIHRLDQYTGFRTRIIAKANTLL
mgnify:FL=1